MQCPVLLAILWRDHHSALLDRQEAEDISAYRLHTRYAPQSFRQRSLSKCYLRLPHCAQPTHSGLVVAADERHVAPRKDRFFSALPNCHIFTSNAIYATATALCTDLADVHLCVTDQDIAPSCPIQTALVGI